MSDTRFAEAAPLVKDEYSQLLRSVDVPRPSSPCNKFAAPSPAVKVEDAETSDDDVVFVKEIVSPSKRSQNAAHCSTSHTKSEINEQGMPKVVKLTSSPLKQTRKRKVSSVSAADGSSPNEDTESQSLKSYHYDTIISNMKSALNNPEVTRDEKIRLMEIIPEADLPSQHEAAQISGIFTKPPCVEGKLIDPDTKAKVLAFFENYNHSLEMPGKSISVTTDGSNTETKQKFLILCNPNELYYDFKDEHHGSKIIFSQFVQLKPKWCVSLMDSWMHRSIVCTQHENVLLLMHATGIQDTYFELISKCVCDAKRIYCSLLRCKHCPGKMELLNYLTAKLQNETCEVRYQQWTMTEVPEIITDCSTMPEYINTLLEKLYSSIPHSFVTESQAQYFEDQKNTLPTSKALILMNFNENYKFLLRDETDCFYWNGKSCTLHSSIIYYKQKGALQRFAMCSFSDDLDHDVGMIHTIQKYSVRFIKDMNPTIKEVEYFTDGSVSSYKSTENFVNLCKHNDDFRVHAKWSFFPDYHGMNECSKIASTVRRIATKAGLKKNAKVNLTTPKKLLDFCVCEIPGIVFEFIDKIEVDKARVTLQRRFKNLPPAGGTRSFHQYVSLSPTCIASNRLSIGTCSKYSVIHPFSTGHDAYDYIVENSFVAAIYLNSWYAARVLEVDHESGDALVDLMHPPGPSETFHWPITKDQVWVPFAHVLCCISHPNCSTMRGEYVLQSDDVKRICEAYSK